MPRNALSSIRRRLSPTRHPRSRSSSALASLLLLATLAGLFALPTGAQAAVVQGVQSGTTTTSVDGVVTVPITSVDLSRSFLIFSSRHDSNRPVGSEVRGRIATSTTLEFERVTNETSVMEIEWYVVEYASGVNVQRGETSQAGETVDVPITAVSSLSQAFVTWSKTPTDTDVSYDFNDPILGELTTTSNLQFRVDGAASTHTIWWQVIEYTDAADINVQKGSTSLLAGSTSTNITLPSSVDLSSSFVLVGYRQSDGGSDIGGRMLRAQITSPTNLLIDRSIAPEDITEIVWQVVELSDGTTVQSGSQNFPTGVSTQNVGLTTVDLNRSVAFASTQPVSGQAMGRSPYAGDDIIGVGQATLDLSSSTQLTMERANTADQADISWFVVQFADLTSQQVDVSLGKSVDVGSPNEGDDVVFTITATNNGPADATGVAITDLLPAGLSYVSDSPSQGSYASGSGIWTVGTLTNGSSATLNITANVGGGTAGTNINNTATLSAVDQTDTVSGNDSASISVDVQAIDLSVTKNVDNPTPSEGNTVVYTVNLTNNGPDDATSVQVLDTLPAGVTYVSSAATQGTYDDITGAWTIGTVANGASVSLDITVTVDGGTAGSTITNTASVRGADQTDINTGNDTDSADITVQSVDLGVTKTVDDATPNEGGSIVYTVTVTNNGPDTATGVELTDQLPAGVTYSADTPSQGSYVSATGIWSVGSLANGASATLDLTATVDGGTAGSTIGNTASVSAVDQTDGVAANDSDSVDVTVQSIDLAVTKTVDVPSPNEGGTVVYTVTVSNGGPDEATGIQIADALPAGVTFVSSSPSQGSYDDVAGTWDVGSIANAGNATLTITATVDASTGGSTISNTASVSAVDQADSNAGNDSDSADITVQSVDLAVTKVVDVATPNENDTVVYTVTVSNAGPDNATGVQVTDQLPAGVTYASSTGQGTYDEVTGLWDVGAVASGGNATLDISATVDTGTAPNTITNTATLTASDQADGNSSNDTDSADITVANPNVDISVVKTLLTTDRPAEGETTTYRITIDNAGPATATNVTILDQLPAGVTFVSASASPGTYDPGLGIWTVGNLTSAATAFLQITVTPDAGTAGTTITNTAQLNSVDQVDSNSANDTSSVDITVTGIDLSITKIVDNNAPLEGESIVYTITVANAGPDSATSVTIEDVLPTGVTFQSFIASQGGFVPPLGQWLAGTILAGENAVLSLTATVDGGTEGTTITNTASVLSSAEVDVNPANDSDSVDITVAIFDADLAVAKSVDNPTPGEGATVVYTVDINNNGPGDMTGIEITDALPTGVTFVSAAASQGSYDDVSGVWAAGSLANGAAASLDITVTVDAGTGGSTITNTAAVTAADQTDSNPGNDSASADINVPAADLALLKTVDDASPLEGSTITYSVTLTNAGPDGGTGIEVTDQLPAGVTYVSHVASQGTYDSVTGVWAVGAIGPVTGATLDITATVDVGMVGNTLTNTATITAADQDDPDALNNTASVDINVGQFDSDLGITKLSDDLSPAAGDTVTFTLTVTNAGPDDANSVEVDDLLPAGLTYLSDAPSQGAYDSGTGLWSVGAVINGGSATLTLAATVDPAAAGTVVTNTATISPSGHSDANPLNDTSSVDLDIFAFVDVASGDALDHDRSTGAGWGDYDNDGDLDIYLGGFSDPNRLLRNDGNDSFVNVATGTMANTSETAAVIWADIDNDGDLDLYNSQQNGSGDRLIRNNNGNFVDVTPLSMQSSDNSTSAAWADFDLDGDVDLYVAIVGGANELYRNDGGNDFVNVTPATLANTGAGTSVAWGDYDNDGDPDLYLSKGGANKLYKNLGNGNFSNVTSGPLGDTGSGFGCAWADFDNDEDLDLWLVNAGSPNRLMRNDGNDVFVDVTPAIMADPATISQSTSWADYDNDGDLDVIVGNASPSIKRGGTYFGSNELFRNDGGGNFVNAADGAIDQPDESQALIWGDYDNDGDLDLYVSNSQQDNRLLRNDQANGNHWLHLDLIGTVSNRSAIGARVRLEAGGQVQIREVSGGDGFICQNSLTVEFGIGTASTVDNVTVFWPSGLTSTLVGVAADQKLTIAETDVTDMNLTKTVDDMMPAVGDTVTFTLVLANDGPGDATGLAVTDLLPAALAFESAVATQGSYDSGTGIWTVGALTNGSSATLDLSVEVVAGAGTSVTNFAAITARDQADPNPLNDNDADDIDIFFFVDITTPPMDDTGPNTGVAWGDHDGDGDLDLYVGAFSAPNQLFQNEGGDVFNDIATGVGANPGKTNGATWADYDNDGDLDLYYSNRGSNTNRLLRNDGGGTLVDVTPPDMASTLNGQGVAWADYDNDGDVDMYLGNLNGANQLFRNDGGDMFVEATPSPLADPGSTTSVAWADYDGDLDLDLYIANGGPNKLFRNDGNDSFVDVTSGGLGDANSSFGADWGDYDNDGDLDLFFVNAGQPNRLMRNDGNDSFVDVTTAPLDDALGQGQSAAWGDIDNDGDVDLYLTNLSGVPNRLIRNDGANGFADITHPLMTDTSGDAQGMAWGDYDSDGDVDLYVANAGQPNRFYRNESNIGSRWIQIDLVGVTSNASGIGARVSVEAGGVTQIREVSGGSGYLSQNSLTVEFGLGTTQTIDNVRVDWPSGIIDIIAGPAVDQRIQIVESPPGNQPPTLTIPSDQQNADGSVIVGVSASATDPDVTDNLVFSATGLPPSLTINSNTGEITGTIDCGADVGSPYLVTIEVDDGNGHMVSDQFTWTVTSAPPVAIADLTSTQMKTANATAPQGTSRIMVTWSGVDPGSTVEVYRKGYGNYPEYDDTGGSVPTSPATPGDALLEGWTLTSITASGGEDTSVARDYWYYVAFITDACGRVSTASNLTSGTLNYHLGDVSDGFTVGTGDRLVNAIDLSFLSALYGRTSADLDFEPVLDFGPTIGGTVDGLPTTDNVIDFEDLIIQSLNFNMVSKDRVVAELIAAPQALLTAHVPYADSKGQELDVDLHLQGDGRVRGLSVALHWDDSIVEPIGFEAGSLLDQHGAPAAIFSSRAGSVDAALFAAAGEGIRGEGILASVRFRVLRPGDPGIRFERVDSRGFENEPIIVETDLRQGVPGTPARSVVSNNYPNPFNPRTTVAYGVGTTGRVTLKIYSVNGRLVRTLVDETLTPGSYEAVWNGLDDQGRSVSSGVYVARLQAPDRADTRRMTLIK